MLITRKLKLILNYFVPSLKLQGRASKMLLAHQKFSIKSTYWYSIIYQSQIYTYIFQ
jgi:hypothetical protein